jgi:hypothetical protein
LYVSQSQSLLHLLLAFSPTLDFSQHASVDFSAFSARQTTDCWCIFTRRPDRVSVQASQPVAHVSQLVHSGVVTIVAPTGTSSSARAVWRPASITTAATIIAFRVMFVPSGMESSALEESALQPAQRRCKVHQLPLPFPPKPPKPAGFGQPAALAIR